VLTQAAYAAAGVSRRQAQQQDGGDDPGRWDLAHLHTFDLADGMLLTVERTDAGLSAARARGRQGGRPPALSAGG